VAEVFEIKKEKERKKKKKEKEKEKEKEKAIPPTLKKKENSLDSFCCCC
jgi:hypothetical protein